MIKTFEGNKENKDLKESKDVKITNENIKEKEINSRLSKNSSQSSSIIEER